MLTLTPPTDDRESEAPPLNETAARATYHAAGKAWRAMNAAGQPPQERVKQAQDGFQNALEAHMSRRSEAAPETINRSDPEAEAQEFAKRYTERMAAPDAVTDQWAFCRYHEGTPDFHTHIVPNPIPPEDRPLAYAGSR